MIRVVVCGAEGRMGKAVCELVAGQSDMILVGGVETQDHPLMGQVVGTGILTARLPEVLGSADVVVDFSTPSATLEHLREAAGTKGVSFVVGTTGFNDDQLRQIAVYARQLPMVIAPNFSVGMNVLYQLTRTAARLLGSGYDIEILEFHHRRKKDVPSGTAKQLGEIAARAVPESPRTISPFGTGGEKDAGEIRFAAVRSGDTVGEHYVIFGTDGERVELVHKVSSRRAFAQGVLRAIRFIHGKPAGCYGMEDVLQP